MPGIGLPVVSYEIGLEIMMKQTDVSWLSKMSQNVHKFQNYWISTLYLESPWKMHSNKYKHA